MAQRRPAGLGAGTMFSGLWTGGTIWTAFTISSVVRSVRRLSRVGMWAGGTVATVAAVLWMISAVWSIERFARGREWSWMAGLDRGRGYVGFGPSVRGTPQVVWYANRREEPMEWRVWFVDMSSSRGKHLQSFLPLWIPVVLAGAPTAWLWWRDSRVPPGHCPKCRYNLAGLAPDAACPECGGAQKAVA